MPYVNPWEEKRGEDLAKDLMKKFGQKLAAKFEMPYATQRQRNWIVKGAQGYIPMFIYAYWAPADIFRISGAYAFPFDSEGRYLRKEILDNLDQRTSLEVSFNLGEADQVMDWVCANLEGICETPLWAEKCYWHKEYVGMPLNTYLWSEWGHQKYRASYDKRKKEHEQRLSKRRALHL